MSNFRIRFIVFVLVLFSFNAVAAEDRASLGFGINAATSGGFSSRTLEQVNVNNVVSGSPAEHAGLPIGDVIGVANDTSIRGTSTRDLYVGFRSLSVGDPLRAEVTLTAKKMIVIIGCVKQ